MSNETLLRSRWDILAHLSFANIICFFSFYLPSVLYSESSVSFFAPQGSGYIWISSMLTFMIGLFSRPIGALIFGIRADAVGAKKTFLGCGILLVLTTLLLGVLPTLNTIGWYASALHIILRLLQGTGLAGAYGCLAAICYECAPPDNKAGYTSFLQLAAPVGYLTAMAVTLVLKVFVGEAIFNQWAWRAPYFMAIFLLPYLYKISHLEIPEEPGLEHAPSYAKFRDIWCWMKAHKDFRRYYAFFLFPIVVATSTFTFFTSVYQLYFLQSVAHMDPVFAKFILALSSFIYLPTYILWGSIADRFGQEKVLFYGLLLGTIGMFPFYKLIQIYATGAKGQALMSSSTVILVLLCALMSAIAIVPYTALVSFSFSNLKDSPYRITLYSVVYNVGFGVAIIAQIFGNYLQSIDVTVFGNVFISVGLAVIALLRAYPILKRQKLI